VLGLIWDILNIQMKQRILIIVILLAVIAIGVFAYYRHGSSVKAYQFTGSVEKVGGNTIAMHGNYNIPEKPELKNQTKAFDAKVKVNEDTKFVRITIHRPKNMAEMIKAGKFVDPEKLKQEVGVGSLADLSSGNVEGATVESESNIYYRRTFTAQSITYYYPVEY